MNANNPIALQATAAANSVIELIGNTPMLRLKHLDTGCCELYAKLESQNPGGSIKDRIALYMINAAEAKGLIKPGDTLVEATAGNTGLGLALIAAQKGYRMLIVMPDKMSMEKEYNLRGMGAEVVRTRSDVQKGHPEYYQEVAARLARETPNAYFINQFANPANVQAHYETTGPEIWAQMDGRIDAMVVGVGSGGTLSGLGRFLKEKNPDLKMVLADPEGSILDLYHKTGQLKEAGSWLVEGIGEDFIPSICDMSLVDESFEIGDAEAMRTGRELLRVEGVMGGSSTGTLLAAALRYCRAQTTPKRVVTLVPDTGTRYVSKMYNDIWMQEKGLL